MEKNNCAISLPIKIRNISPKANEGLSATYSDVQTFGPLNLTLLYSENKNVFRIFGNILVTQVLQRYHLWKVTTCLMDSMPASSKTDPPLSKAEPISNSDRACGMTDLRREKITRQQQTGERGESGDSPPAPGEDPWNARRWWERIKRATQNIAPLASRIRQRRKDIHLLY